MTIAPIGVPLIKKIILCLTHFSSHFTGDSDKKRKIIFINKTTVASILFSIVRKSIASQAHNRRIL